jgi:hypothetical protein
VSGPALSQRQLNRATLERQLLLGRERLSAAEAVRRVVALQAQEPASPYIALWNRVAAFDPADLDDAFSQTTLLTAPLMRITLHAVHVEDYPAFHRAMQPTLRGARLNDDRFRRAGLSIDEADALVEELLAHASQPRTNGALEAWLDERLGVLPRPGVWWAIRSYGPFVHAPTGGPWSFGARPAYVAAPGGRPTADPEVALRRLVRRYLEGFGPASVQDIGQFALVHRPRVRAALEALSGELATYAGPAGPLYDVADGSLSDPDTPAPPRLLPMWDSILLAYADRSRVIPEDYRRVLIRSNGDVLPAVLVDGLVRGVWRPHDDGIEVTAFEPLTADDWDRLAEEARSLGQLLGQRDPRAYSRYARWWQGLPAQRVEVLG